MKEYICIDIGGTSVKYGIINENEQFRRTGECPTEAYLGGPHIMKKVTELIKGLMKECSPEGICVSTAGMVNCETGTITYAAPLIPEYTGTPVKEILEKSFSIPCEVENDVNCAGLAECYAGAAKGSKLSVCLTVGTGIGGALIMDNKVVHGFSGSACEIGYMHLPGGMFQDIGAASILVKKIAQKKAVSEEKINGKYVFEQAKKGDPDCIKAIDEMADVLGMGIANICYVVNPEVVVLGGGIMAQKEYLQEKLDKSVKKYLIPALSDKTTIAFARNQNQAGMLGAYFHFRSRRNEV